MDYDYNENISLEQAKFMEQQRQASIFKNKAMNEWRKNSKFHKMMVLLNW